MFGTDFSLADLSITGNPLHDSVLLLTAVTFIAAFAALRSSFVRRSGDASSSRNARENPAENQGNAINGRLERLDKNLSEFRTETLRALELMRMRIEAGGTASSQQVNAEQDRAERSSSREPADAGATAAEPLINQQSTEASQAEVPHSEALQVSSTETPSRQASPEKPASLASRMKATRKGLFDRLRSVFSAKPALDEESIEELRSLLIGSDLGAKTVEALIVKARAELQSGQVVDEARFRELVRGSLVQILGKGSEGKSREISPERVTNNPKIVLVVGVNGAGKTTTVAKLAHQLTQQGAKVLLVAADTFRAAAVAQLSEWAQRLNVPVVTGAENAKPQTVIFEAMERLGREQFDVVLIDTAGRLQTKLSLMQELEGVRNAISRHQTGAPHETLLVVDGSTGQNAISQAREFNDATPLTGLVVTKLDGTPKGGVVVAIAEEFGIPVRYIGVGESPADLRPFSPEDFVAALFEASGDVESEQGSNVLPLSSAHAEQRRIRRAAGQ